ncbi:hypothetical protein PTKIN_Ptkin11bG0084600 [Pterospermum kingtungense]
MGDQAANQVINNMERESVSIETLDLAPSTQNKLFLKLKISKTLKRCGQHICPVCSKGFSSGKALGGHIRIHVSSKNNRHRKISKLHPRNIHRGKAKKRISKMVPPPKTMDGAGNQPLNDQQGNEKVSCCICNKEFRSMKSLFGHMRNHPERSWRGIRPPPSDKNSCCSSVSENNEALEVDQISFGTGKGSGTGSGDLLKSLPKWTNTSKRCGKFTSDDNEIPEAAYSLMKLARGDFFDLGQSRKYSSTDKTRSSALENSEGKGKAKLKTLPDQERVPSESKRGDSHRPDKEKNMVELLLKELDCDKIAARNRKEVLRENKMKVNANDAKIIETNRCFDQFQKLPIELDEEDGDPSTMEGKYGGVMFPSSQTPGFYPKNPNGGLFEAPLNETASPEEGKHLYSKTLFLKTTLQTAEGSQVCSPKMLDFDLNEPYVAPDGEGTTQINSI